MRSLNGRTISQVMMFALASLFVGLGLVYPKLNAVGQYNETSPPPPPVIPPPPPPPPIIHTPPPTNPLPNIPIPVTTDITTNTPNANVLFNTAGPGAIDGLGVLSSNKMPTEGSLGGPTDFILVLAKDVNTSFDRISQYAVKLNNGQLLCGVRKPSNTGMVVSDMGKVAIFSNAKGADAMVTFRDGVFRVANLDGLGENVRVELTGAPFRDFKSKVFALKPGFELVASPNALTRKDVRPGDGLGRRQTQLIENRHLAISQFSVESALKNADLLANLSQKDTGSKERRILADVSKMAEILKQVGGNWGYDANSKQ